MKITWDQFELYTQKVLEKIIKDNFKPEAIVAVGNSGLIPAVILAKAFHIKDIQIITISSYNNENKKSEPKIISSNLSFFLKGKTVLCVDDIVATGETFDIAVSEIFKFEPKEIKFATPVVSEYVCKKLPDYYGESILRGETDFITFPWDK